MNDIDKLRQLTNVYRTALQEGINGDQWAQQLKEKITAYGRDFIVRESELIADWIDNNE